MTFKVDLTTILTLLSLFGLSETACLQTGCAPETTELERAWTSLNQDIIAPAVTKAIEETSTRTATLQGGAQGIEPGYEVDVFGFFGTGIHSKVMVRLVGVSGQLTGHVQADAGQAGSVPPPVVRTEAIKPE